MTKMMNIHVPIGILMLCGLTIVHIVENGVTSATSAHHVDIRNESQILCDFYLGGKDAHNISDMLEVRHNADVNGDNIIQFDEYLKFLKAHMGDVDEELERILFKLIDRNSETEQTITDSLNAFVHADKDDDGSISMDECLSYQTYLLQKAAEELATTATT